MLWPSLKNCLFAVYSLLTHFSRDTDLLVFYTVANRLDPRSGPWSWLQPVCLQHNTFFDKILQKKNFFKLMQTDFSWWPFCIPGCNGLRMALTRSLHIPWHVSGMLPAVWWAGPGCGRSWRLPTVLLWGHPSSSPGSLRADPEHLDNTHRPDICASRTKLSRLINWLVVFNQYGTERCNGPTEPESSTSKCRGGLHPVKD